jgi:RNA polymerase sigma factor (sigma-70 family)
VARYPAANGQPAKGVPWGTESKVPSNPPSGGEEPKVVASPAGGILSGPPCVTWDDPRLVQACIQGDERAWICLIGKYRNLVYSIPRKYGASPEDAADIFQAVCLELFHELPRLRSTQSVRSWLTTVAAHQSFHWKRRKAKESKGEVFDETHGPAVAATIAAEVEREQAVREAMNRLPARCRELVRMLFFEQPALPYAAVAERLGIAKGSIGFLRARCLKRLQQSLEELGY